MYIFGPKYIFSYLEKPSLTRAFSHLKIQVRPCRFNIFFSVPADQKPVWAWSNSGYNPTRAGF